MPNTPTRSVAPPKRLLLLSVDPAEESTLREYLSHSEDETYELTRADGIDAIKGFVLGERCDAVLLDMRIDREKALEAIHFLAETKHAVALVCLCRNHRQLRDYPEVVHLIDDYLLAESLAEGELPTRISHAIQKCRKEYELTREQDLLHALLDNIPDAIYFKDRQSRFIEVNKAMTRSYGFGAESILGKTDFDLFTEEHARPAFEDEKEIMRTDTPIIGKLEKETLTNGQIRWVSTTKLPLKDAQGNITGTMGISRNITELKEAEDSLARERNLLRTVLDNVPDRIFVKDTHGHYIATNKKHMKFLGAKSEQEVIGSTLFDHVPEETALKYQEMDEKIIQTCQGILNIEENRTHADGSIRWYLTSKVPLIDADGKIVGLVGISRDITEQKKNEEALKNAITILNETQLQLIEAEKLKTVGRLAAGVAHEVKNPLSVVMLGVDFLKGRLAGNKDFVELLEDMQQAVTKANDVVFELLDYSTPHEINMVPTQLNDLVHRVLGLMRHNLNEAHVTLVDETTPDLPEVLVDAPKMEQVFINLVLNAISFMSQGGDLLIRSYSQRMQSAGANVSSEMTELFRIGDRIVVIEVVDSGPGIDPKYKDKVFDPFYSTKSTGEGTGLGLSVTRSIVEMHRGLITLDNRKDKQGACARLLFPTAESQSHHV